MLSRSLDKLRFILSMVNSQVAVYQDSNQFKILLDNLDSKSTTNYWVNVNNTIEQKKFTVI